jgi:adenylate cyclase
VILPIWRGELLVAFVCLGPKRSGDVITRSDAQALRRLLEAVSARTVLFDVAELDREGRLMEAALRRYVPSAVLTQLAAGRNPSPGTREVSVLFVDLRGYTAYAEPRPAAEVFSTVNRYAEAVSTVVSRSGGAVVEFSGDGMLAVFGAPEDLAGKERIAVQVALEILAAVGGLALGAQRDSRGLAVAIGIATGEVYVGNLQAADRLVWATIGDTTNLAARLQDLARDLAASVVIDSRTRDRAGATAAAFLARPGIRLRGRSEPVDVYFLAEANVVAA